MEVGSPLSSKFDPRRRVADSDVPTHSWGKALVLFCFDSRRRLPSDVCLPRPANARLRVREKKQGLWEMKLKAIMERPHQVQACSMGSGLTMSILQSNMPSLLPDLGSNSSFCKITDETFPYVSGIFDDTMDPSFVTNEPVAATNLPDRKQLKSVSKPQDEVILGNQAKPAYSSWLTMPIENDQTVDFSMSITSAQEDHKDINHVTEASPKGDTPDVSCHPLECTSNAEKTKNQSRNSTFDMAKDLKDRFSGLNLAATGSSNVTFEKSVELQEKSSGLSCTISNDDASVEEKLLGENPFNSTVDVCGLSNSSSQQNANQKLNGTADITQSNGSKHEQSNEERTCSIDCEKQSPFPKPTEKANITVDLAAGVSPEVVQPGFVRVESVDGTFTKQNATTDLATSEQVPDSTTNATINIVKSSNTELSAQSNSNCSATVKETPVSAPSVPGNTAAPVRVDVIVCSDRSLDLPETDCKEEPQGIFKRKNGTSDDAYLNLDISQSSMFSLEEMLDLKPCPLVASTPIVLGRGFDRLGSARPTNIQKRLSVINSIHTQPNEDSAGVSEHEGSDASKANNLSVKSDSCRQIQIADGSSNSTTAEAAIGNKPLSKLAVRRNIPQPSCKSNIPKTHLPPRPSTLQSAVVKSKTVTGVQALNQPETSSSALHSMRRTVQLNKWKTLAPAKNISTAATVKSLSAAVSTTMCNMTADKKAGNVCLTLPKPSGLQPPGRGRFGLKPPGSAVSSEETSHAQTNKQPTSLSAMRTRNSLLPGFSQKHVSSAALPLAKRKKTDLQNQLGCAPSGSATEEGIQKNVPASTDITAKRHNSDCGNCTLLQEKLRTFHEELGGFLQEPGRLSADCKKWVSLQHKLESYLEEVRRLQSDHH